MKRVIFEVYAKVVDANGSYNTLTGYPKVFDSRHYSGDVDKTRRRAEGEFHETVGAMCKRDDRQVQTVLLMDAAGVMYMVETMGEMPEEPDPEPESENVEE